MAQSQTLYKEHRGMNMTKSFFDLTPKDVKRIETKHRKIVTKIPVPESIPIIEQLRKYEPLSMGDQLPAVWDRAEGYQIYDKWGNCWIDFSSTIFVANAGHAHPHIVKAIQSMIDSKMLNCYYYPSEIRAKLVKKIIGVTPSYFEKVLLLTTGAEATEAAMKIALINGKKTNPRKKYIIGTKGNFHGKSLGSIQVSGNKGSHWVPEYSSFFAQLPFPYEWELSKNKLTGEAAFHTHLNALLADKKIQPNEVAAFMLESYQGWGAVFYPMDYMKALVTWARANGALVIFDEIQAGYGRTGKMFAYEHYEVEPDMICIGKATTSSLPLAGVLGRKELLDNDPSYNSTHGGNPVACAAALANLEVFEEEKLLEKARGLEKVMLDFTRKWQQEYPDRIKRYSIKGAVGAIYFYKPGTEDLDIDLVDEIIEKSLQKGLMSIRTMCGTIKIGPPLNIPKDALLEGMEIMRESLKEILH